jgi:opacity protein-like surface antigen
MGLECALGDRWSAVVEALYAGFGNVSYREYYDNGRAYVNQSGEVALGIARAGINYRF